MNSITLPNNPPFFQNPDADKLIVFIHGINGDPRKTWTNEDSKFFWPEKLAGEADFKDADVLAFGYASRCGPSLNIREISNSLNTTLNAALKKPYKSISFVAHSMGGLVVREFILAHWPKLNVPIDSVILLSTPNSGNGLANMGKHFCGSDALGDLQTGKNSYIDALNDRWRDEYEQPNSVKPFHFSAGYEIAPIFLAGIIVEKDSATAFSQQISAFQKDHFTIAKPNDIGDELYIWAKQRLLKEPPSLAAKTLNEAQEKRYTEVIAQLQKELQGTDLKEALHFLSTGKTDEALALLSEREPKDEQKILEIAQARFAKAQVYELKLDYANARKYYEDAVRLAPDNSLYLNEAGINATTLGQYDKAIEYYERALASDLKTFGPEHPGVAIRWNNLGAAWMAKGQYDKAIEYYERALASGLKTLGPEHPGVATGWNNLGGAWMAKGQYDKAIEYYERALASDLKTFGPEHPGVATGWNNLGGAWDSKGQYDKAIEYYEKALASDLKTLGPEHPQVAIYWNNLGGAWKAKGQYDKAIEYYEKALTVFEKAKLAHRVELVKGNIEEARKRKSGGR